jgi:hypothetical protein
MQQANQGADADKPADLTKLFAVQKKAAPNKQHSILSRMMKRKVTKRTKLNQTN